MISWFVILPFEVTSFKITEPAPPTSFTVPPVVLVKNLPSAILRANSPACKSLADGIDNAVSLLFHFITAAII